MPRRALYAQHQSLFDAQVRAMLRASAFGAIQLMVPMVAAIKGLADALFAAGRTDVPVRVEEKVWAREAEYSTGLGHGFAIPHCRTDAVGVNSVGILKLKNPIEWGSLDGKPVNMVIMLAMRESDANNEHMKVLSVLARKLMHEEFRHSLLRAADAGAVLSILQGELTGPAPIQP